MMFLARLGLICGYRKQLFWVTSMFRLKTHERKPAHVVWQKRSQHLNAVVYVETAPSFD
jgi:hypothetical protein